MSKVSRDKRKAANANNVDSADDADKKNSSKVNDGKCCRCVYRHDKICTCKTSTHNTEYVARKCGCPSFKYND